MSHFATSVKVLQAGLGFAFLPENIIRKELEAGSLVPISPGRRATQRNQLIPGTPWTENTGPASRARMPRNSGHLCGGEVGTLSKKLSPLQAFVKFVLH